ncbi:ABC-type oligopeptide transport system ATPase subunit [Lipingzhangella halophila]|uniref:ABC-type oligopeptide transport system ATPase subunit n=1 Tax=Lipingzhangella halophila TaxID=1783352 RepID=A0A7W7RG14_9ACTN|nr:hypothetical protein [Lipingzhangella halophila]MBB4931205.1 ABC-type oligopeptide transport system ATPase subunit [Lipingzhangella halophila]
MVLSPGAVAEVGGADRLCRAPAPYTRALTAAVPEPEPGADQ